MHSIHNLVSLSSAGDTFSNHLKSVDSTVKTHIKLQIFWQITFVYLTLPVQIPDKEKKLSQIFTFTLLCGASKGFMKALCENKNLT